MTDIVFFKEELYNIIKNYSGVVGTTIRRRNGMLYIVVLLSKITSKASSIPQNFKGNKVELEVVGETKPISKRH